MHRCRCRSLVLLSTSPTDVSQRALQHPLTEIGAVFGGAPIWVPPCTFAHSVLMQIKIPLEALFTLQFGAFLQEEFKLGFFLAVENCLCGFGGVQVHSTIGKLIED